MLEKNEISSINWCASEKQLADCLTKATLVYLQETVVLQSQHRLLAITTINKKLLLHEVAVIKLR